LTVAAAADPFLVFTGEFFRVAKYTRRRRNKQTLTIMSTMTHHDRDEEAVAGADEVAVDDGVPVQHPGSHAY